MPFLFQISGSFQHEHVVHLPAAHVLGVEAVFCVNDKASHGNEGGFGQEEFGAAVVTVSRVCATELGIHLVCNIGRYILHAMPVFINMAHVLVHNVIGGAAEVGACLAVHIVQTEFIGAAFQYIGGAVVETVVKAVRSFIGNQFLL